MDFIFLTSGISEKIFFLNKKIYKYLNECSNYIVNTRNTYIIYEDNGTIEKSLKDLKSTHNFNFNCIMYDNVIKTNEMTVEEFHISIWELIQTKFVMDYDFKNRFKIIILDLKQSLLKSQNLL